MKYAFGQTQIIICQSDIFNKKQHILKKNVKMRRFLALRKIMSKFKHILIGLCASTAICAQPEISMDGNIYHEISPKNQQMIALTHFKLSHSAKAKLAQHIHQSFQPKALMLHQSQSFGKPSAVQLGMNEVPVLNQGTHGSCVTFALTAALDAAIGKGDYISQLCTLSLGRYLENHAYQDSGWNGSTTNVVMAQLNSFGVVNKQNENTMGCGGLNEYPIQGNDPLNEMSVDDFHQISEKLDSLVYSYLSNISDPFKFLFKEIPASTLENNVKEALNHGHRVLIGVLLPLDDVLGAWGKNHTPNDTWVLTDNLKNIDLSIDADALDNFAGHEMVITGYDDNITIKDSFGKSHKGAFTLRNSWGENAGFKGDYYMSYDFFSAFAWELNRLLSFKDF